MRLLQKIYVYMCMRSFLVALCSWMADGCPFQQLSSWYVANNAMCFTFRLVCGKYVVTLRVCTWSRNSLL